MRNAVLVENGVPRGAIHLDAAADDFHRFVAEEIQRYIELLTGGRLPVVTEPDSAPSGGLILVCGPQANDAVGGLAERGAVDLGGLTADGAYVLKSVDIDGRGGMVVAGADDAGTMYAAYELLERLGVVFQLTGDIIPERKPDLVLPELDVVEEPARKFRGVHVWHAYSWYMGLADYRRLIDQLAKMKMNVLQFFWGMGAPWVEVFHEGVRGELTTTPESGYLAIGKDTRSWGRSVHTTTGNRSDVRVGRECFPHERLCAPEFRDVNSEDEAYAVAVPFLREIIRYAHRRRVQLWLVSGELPFVAPNLAPRSAKVDHGVAASESYSYQRYCGVAVPTGDPAALDIWEAALCAVIETYPEADSYGVWAPEHSPDFDDDEATRALRQEATTIREHMPSLEEIHAGGNFTPNIDKDLEFDAMQIRLASELIGRVKRRHPDARLGVTLLFRGYLMRALDRLLPKDVWIANMEDCGNGGSQMDYYRGIAGRDLIVIPRIVDDGCELHMQMNATMYDRDEIVTGAEAAGAAGIIGQLDKERGGECSTRFLADGCWDAGVDAQSFYTGYLPRLYGTDAAPLVVDAYRLLEAAERDLVWWGRSEIFISYHDFSPCKLRTGVELRDGRPDIDRAELERAIEATWDDSDFWFWRRTAVGDQHGHDRPLRPDALWRRRAGQYRAVAGLLRQARPQVPAGSLAELDYVIFKTENFAAYFDVLQECEEARIELDRAYLARLDRDEADAGDRLERCRAALQRADRHAQGAAGQMLAYSDEKAERHLLFRFNQNVIASIESGRDFVDGVIATHRSQIR
jgi:hypothetical protein